MTATPTETVIVPSSPESVPRNIDIFTNHLTGMFECIPDSQNNLNARFAEAIQDARENAKKSNEKGPPEGASYGITVENRNLIGTLILPNPQDPSKPVTERVDFSEVGNTFKGSGQLDTKHTRHLSLLYNGIGRELKRLHKLYTDKDPSFDRNHFNYLSSIYDSLNDVFQVSNNTSLTKLSETNTPVINQTRIEILGGGETEGKIDLETYRRDLAAARESGLTEGKAETQTTIAQMRQETAAQLDRLRAQIESLKRTGRPEDQTRIQELEAKTGTLDAELAKLREARPPGETTDINTVTSALKEALAAAAEGKDITRLAPDTQRQLFQTLGADGMAVLSQMATRPVMGQEQVNQLTEFAALTQAVKIALKGEKIPVDLMLKLSGDSQNIITALFERNIQTPLIDTQSPNADIDKGNGNNDRLKPKPLIELLTALKEPVVVNGEKLGIDAILKKLDDHAFLAKPEVITELLVRFGLDLEAFRNLPDPLDDLKPWEKALSGFIKGIHKVAHPDTQPQLTDTDSAVNLEHIRTLASWLTTKTSTESDRTINLVASRIRKRLLTKPQANV